MEASINLICISCDLTVFLSQKKVEIVFLKDCLQMSLTQFPKSIFSRSKEIETKKIQAFVVRKTGSC